LLLWPSLASRREESLRAIHISSLQKRRKKFQEIFENSRIKLFVSRRQQRTLFADLK